MLSTRPITAAEQALVDAFSERVDSLHGDGAIKAIRDGFIQDIRENGLPTRRIEAWHYTDLRNLLKKVPDGAGRADVAAVAPLVDGSAILALVDGKAGDANAPGGVAVTHYRDALSEGIAAQRMVLNDSDDLIGRLNGAFANDGFGLAVDAGTRSDCPL